MKSIQDTIPRSRVNLRYRTMIEGELKEVELPFRMMILADLSLGSSTDREVELDSRKLRKLDGRNIDAMMENMRMSLSFKVNNHIDQEEESLDVKLPIKNRTSFLASEVAPNVPQIRALLLLRKLLLEMQANVDNRKETRKLMQEIFGNPDQIEQLKKELSVYSDYHLPEGKALPAGAASPVAALKA